VKYAAEFVEKNKEEISKKPNLPANLAKLKEGFKFADPRELIAAYQAECKKLPPPEKKPEVKEKTQEKEEDEKALLIKYKKEKLVARDMTSSLNDPEVLKQHESRTEGKIITRFPPEPNGYLHIGHCKAMRFSFKVAADYNGYTNLRYDDTNPESESQEFIDSIKENVYWLGYKPKNVFFASDNFEKIYDVAVQLIQSGKAYACKLSAEESKKLREQRKPSPYRDTSPEENMRQFKLMKAGYYAEGEICLRAKISYTHDNPTLRDPAIYRIKYIAHPHRGNDWCIYPLYDFVHSLCDCFEDITHSLCSLEFESRRELYYWSLDTLNMYKPYVWEFSRLNITYNVLSKRKIAKLIAVGLMSGWDDPRLLTINGLRRRGYPPEALNNFCDLLSVTRRGNDNVIQFTFLEHCIRQYLLEHAPRTFVITEPALLELTNFQAESLSPSGLCHDLKLGRFVYVEKNDVRMEDSADFYGIAPGKIVRLKHGPFVKITGVRENDSGSFNVTGEIMKQEDLKDYKKVKGILHFVDRDSAFEVEVREYDRPFYTEYPGEKTGDFIDDFNMKSKRVLKEAKIWSDFIPKVVSEGRYQFERMGFFFVDSDSNVAEKKLVFNKIVSLKESEEKKKIATAKA